MYGALQVGTSTFEFLIKILQKPFRKNYIIFHFIYETSVVMGLDPLSSKLRA